MVDFSPLIALKSAIFLTLFGPQISNRRTVFRTEQTQRPTDGPTKVKFVLEDGEKISIFFSFFSFKTWNDDDDCDIPPHSAPFSAQIECVRAALLALQAGY